MTSTHPRRRGSRLAALAWLLASTCAVRSPAAASPPELPHMSEGDYVVENFHFASGETLPELRLHYTSLGKPHRGTTGHIDNAVLLLHDTGGTGRNFLADKFAGVLFGKGQPLDANQYFIILPDAIGHGLSSKPSDGLHAHFPQYHDLDMVNAQFALITQGLQIDHLRLVLGTSMGCMHTFIWGENHPDFSDALMPLACLPVSIVGRDRVWRDLIVDAIRSDPQWLQGDYKAEPMTSLKAAAGLLLLAASAPLPLQTALPSRAAVDEFLNKYLSRELAELDANDLIYQLSASRDDAVAVSLESIREPVMWINSADDFMNPPELGIAEREVRRLKSGRFVLLPSSELTHGHGTANWAALWQKYLIELLAMPPV